MDKRTGNNSQSAKPLIGMILGIWVLVAAAYFAFSGNEPQKPIWNEEDRRVADTGAQSEEETPSTSTATVNTGSTADTGSMDAGTGQIPPGIADTPAGRDARDSDTPAMTGGTGATATQTGTTATGGLTEYWNGALNYGFSLPRAAYFMGTGPRDGASHSVAIKSGTGVTDFETADVRVWFYPRTILSQVSSADMGFYQDPSTSRTYLKLGSGTLMIEGDFKSPIVNTIVQTARVE